MRKVKTWKCQRVSGGVKCSTVNPKRKRICSKCGKTRPVTKKPAHMAALDHSYEHYIEINGGEFCGICGVGRTPERRLHRDHDHKTGEPRGLLCWPCNRQLPARIRLDWLRRAVAYLERTSDE